MGNLKECLKPHTVLHGITGFGVGYIVIGLFPSLVQNVLVIGVVIVVAAVITEYTMKGKKKK